jgi:WD40 repeat protein
MSLMLFYMANSFHLARTPKLRLAHLKRPTPHFVVESPEFRAVESVAVRMVSGVAQFLTRRARWGWCLALSPDGHRALSGSDDKSLRLWDLESDEPQTLEGHTDTINAVTLTTDGHRALSGCYDQTLRLWDVESGKTLRIFECYSDSAHPNWVWDVAPHP